MITVHHLENSRSQRILWLLEELGLEYEVKRYARDPRTMLAPPELKSVHPLGRSPVITDGDVTVAESGAIIEYLIDRHGDDRLKPTADDPARPDYTYWLHYAEGSLMPLLVMKLIFGRLSKPPMPLPMRPFGAAIGYGVQKQFLDPRIEDNLHFCDSALAERDWFAGDELSGADIQMSFPLEAAAARGGLNERYPNLAGFLERAQARPAYARALERGGPYELMR